MVRFALIPLTIQFKTWIIGRKPHLAGGARSLPIANLSHYGTTEMIKPIVLSWDMAHRYLMMYELDKIDLI